jgi:hypothetical protein
MSDDARRTQFTEEETLAILEAESLGKPHPFRERETYRLAFPASLGQTTRELEERKSQDEKAKVLHLGLWPDDKRAMPGDFIACALFSAQQEKDTTHLTRVQLASANGLAVTYTGVRLTQVHADVWEAIMHRARQLPEGSLVYFTERHLLRSMGRHTGKSQRDQLKQWLAELSATCVEIKDAGEQRYWGSLLPRGADKPEQGDTMYAVEINRDLAKMFDAGFALVDWDQRQRLRGKWLALWFQRHVSRFTKPMHLLELKSLSGSTASDREFRRMTAKALADLEAVGTLKEGRLDRKTDIVYFTRGGGSPKAVIKPSTGGLPTHAGRSAAAQGSLPLPVVPAVTETALEKFRELYPTYDPKACLADFTNWLAKKGATATYPNAAFLGFAKDWKPKSESRT